MPHPAFATSPTYVADSAKGHRVLRFTTAMSLRDAAAFVETAYPAAGYQIIGGDSEQHEADIEFARGQLRGKTKLAGEAPCTTTWTVLTISPS